MEHLASGADHIADLLSTQASAVSTIQSPDHNVFIELKEGQRRLESRLNKMEEDLARLSFNYNRGPTSSLDITRHENKSLYVANTKDSKYR